MTVKFSIDDIDYVLLDRNLIRAEAINGESMVLYPSQSSDPRPWCMRSFGDSCRETLLDAACFSADHKALVDYLNAAECKYESGTRYGIIRGYGDPRGQFGIVSD